MLCSNCGTANDDSAKVCKSCGMEFQHIINETKEYSNDYTVITDTTTENEKKRNAVCPKCGSSNILLATRDEGSEIDGFRACLGYLFFGLWGSLLCGLANENNTSVFRKCKDCDYEF